MSTRSLPHPTEPLNGNARDLEIPDGVGHEGCRQVLGNCRYLGIGRVQAKVLAASDAAGKENLSANGRKSRFPMRSVVDVVAGVGDELLVGVTEAVGVAVGIVVEVAVTVATSGPSYLKIRLAGSSSTRVEAMAHPVVASAMSILTIS